MTKNLLFLLILISISCGKESSNSITNCDWKDATLVGKNFKLSKIDSLSVFCPECITDSVYGKYATTLTFLTNNDLVVKYGGWSFPGFGEEFIKFSPSDKKYYLTKTNSSNNIRLESSNGNNDDVNILQYDCNSFSYNATFFIDGYLGRKVDSQKVQTGPNTYSYRYTYVPVTSKVTFTSF